MSIIFNNMEGEIPSLYLQQNIPVLRAGKAMLDGNEYKDEKRVINVTVEDRNIFMSGAVWGTWMIGPLDAFRFMLYNTDAGMVDRNNMV